jgi:hypothetical protein
LKRHPGLITVFGAAIVFFTYVVREVFREGAHGTKDSYDRAAASFTLVDDLISISDRVRHLSSVPESVRVLFARRNAGLLSVGAHPKGVAQ